MLARAGSSNEGNKDVEKRPADGKRWSVEINYYRVRKGEKGI